MDYASRAIMTANMPWQSMGSQHKGVLYQRPISRAFSIDSELDTEFEEDASVFSDYQGRRSEESFDTTTISAGSGERTPPSNDVKAFQFHMLPDHSAAHLHKLTSELQNSRRPTEGPTGPHLFRQSYQHDHLPLPLPQWSPIESPRHEFAPVKLPSPTSLDKSLALSSSIESWTPLDVADIMRQAGFDEPLVGKFLSNDISGIILRQLQFDDLKELGVVSFGQRHMLWDAIRRLRGGPAVAADSSDILQALGSMHIPDHNSNEAESCKTPIQLEECPRSESTENFALDRFARGATRRRALRDGLSDVISPAESASIVAIEQLLPTPHQCSKGEDCPKWRRWRRKMDKIAEEFPLELGQIVDNSAPSPIETQSALNVVDPSIVASSDVLGPGTLPSLRLREDTVRSIRSRDPQDNVRQFLRFQHYPGASDDTQSPPKIQGYEEPLTTNRLPQGDFRTLPKLQIPQQALVPPPPPPPRHPDRPATAQPPTSQSSAISSSIYGNALPLQTDIPVTAMPRGPVAREASNSVPPDMRYGVNRAIRPNSFTGPTAATVSPIVRSASVCHTQRLSNPIRRHPPTSFHLRPRDETPLSPIQDDERDSTSTAPQHAGYMRKRKTRLLRHEWQEHHFRLTGTTLAMHRDAATAGNPLDTIDVDNYNVACSSTQSTSTSKLNAALHRLGLSLGQHAGMTAHTPTTLKKVRPDKGMQKEREQEQERDEKNFKLPSLPPTLATKQGSAAAQSAGSTPFTFQLVPASTTPGPIRHRGPTLKTHHFAVGDREERIDWMRDLMLAKALKGRTEAGGGLAREKGWDVCLNGRAL